MNTLSLSAEVMPVTIYYCKAGLKTGLVVRVEQGGARWACAGVQLIQTSGDMLADNSTGKAKKSGARCVLVLRDGTVLLTNPQLLSL